MVDRGLGLVERWNASEYAAGYSDRMNEIPGSDEENLHWYRGWEFADTELLGQARREKSSPSQRTIELVKKGAAASANGGLHVIAPKAAVALLAQSK